jgi:ferredoxin
VRETGEVPGPLGRAAVSASPVARDLHMAFVVTQPCQGCKYTDCVTVCPMDCFHEGEQMLYIDPESCIDCEACVPECPVEAIYHDSAVPPPWHGYIALNAEGARRYPLITQKK